MTLFRLAIRYARLAMGLALLLPAVACATGQAMTVRVANAGPVVAHIVVKLPGDRISSYQVAPGYTTTRIAPKTGTYSAIGILDADWLQLVGTRRDDFLTAIGASAGVDGLPPGQAGSVSEIATNLITDVWQAAASMPDPAITGCEGLIMPEAPATVTLVDDTQPGGPSHYRLVCNP